MLDERLSSEPAPPPTEQRNRAAQLRRLVSTLRVPAWMVVTAIVAVAFSVTALWARGVHDFSVMPDELGYVKQSIEIARTGFLIGPHNFFFNSWAQLLPLISAPLFGTLGMAQAYYASHTLYAFLLASTAIPAYLLARELGLGRLAGYLTAALSVAVPWLAMSGVVMTEVVAYPVFVWAALAMLRALHEPSARRDIVAVCAVVVAFFTRTQLVALGPVLVIAALIHDTLLSLDDRGELGSGRAVLWGIRQTFDRHRVLWILCCIALVGWLGLLLTGNERNVLGNYVGPATGDILPRGTMSAGLLQLDGIVVAIGVLPLTLAATWALGTVGRPRQPARHAFAVLLIALVSVFVVVAGSFVQRFVEADTDRYLFYLAPLLFLGAAAWVVDRRGSLLTLAVVGALVAWVLLTNNLQPSNAVTILNTSYNFHRVLVARGSDVMRAVGLPHADPRIALVVAASLFALIAYLARDRLARWQALLVVTVPLLAFGIAETGYAMTSISRAGTVYPASNGSYQGWVDRLVPSGSTVGVVIAPADPLAEQHPENTWSTWWETSFWNKTVRRAFVLPGGDEFVQGSVGGVSEDLVHGRMAGLDGVNYLIKLTTDPRFGLRAPLVSPPAGTRALYRLPAGAPLLYGTSGVDQFGNVAPRSSFVRVFGARGVSPTSYRVTLTLQVHSPTRDCPCRLMLGSGYGDAGLPGPTRTGPVEVKVTRVVTVRPGGYAQLGLDARGKDGSDVVWLGLISVQITPVGKAGTSQRSPVRG